jgi:nucleoside-diphosphate-sugar epimerase
MIRVYEHFLAHPELRGVFNAGFENISILEIAERVKKHVPAEIVVTPSNDPRSYRLSSKKLLATGFQPKHGVEDGIREVIAVFQQGHLKDREEFYNIRTMKKLGSLA